MQSLKEITLYTWKFYISTVTTLEAIYIYRHLLTFKSRRNTTDKHDLINTFQLCYDCIVINGTFGAYVYFHICAPSLHKLIPNFYIIILSCLNIYRSACSSSAPSMMFLHLLSINNCIVPFERVYRAGAMLSKFPVRDLRKKGFVMSVRIITDSASDMSPAEHPALRVLPLSVTFGTDVYMDGVDIDHQRFYEMLVERDELPKTGQVNPYAFSQAIAEARETGDEAVIITVGAKLSGTNQSARTALAEAPGGDVFVVDSNNVTLGERVLVEYALRLVDEGQGAAQVAAAVEAVRDRVVVIGLLETLEYLVRGGRLSAAAGAVGTLLNVKPVVAAEDGLIVQLGKARGSKNGRNLLNQKVEKAGGVDFSMPLALGYTGLSDAVLKKYIEDSAALWAGHTEGELPVHTIGATIGTHVGPGAVAVAFFQPAN